MSFPFIRTMHKICRYDILSRHVRDALSYTSNMYMEGFNAVTSYLWLRAYTCAASYIMSYTISLRCVHQLVCHLAMCFIVKKLTDSARSAVSCHQHHAMIAHTQLSGMETLVCYQPNFALNSIQTHCDIAEVPFAIWHGTQLLRSTH